MASFLADFNSGYDTVRGAYDQAKQDVQKNKLAQLAPAAITGDPQALAQAAAISPQAASAYSAQHDELVGRTRMAAQYLANAIKSGDQAAIMAARQNIKPYMDTLKPGTSYPLDRDPAEELPMIEAYLSQYQQAGTGNGVQSTYIDDKGQRVAVMRDGTVQVLGQNAANNQIIDTGDGFYGVNKGNLSAAPVVVGGGQQGGVQAPTQVDMEADIALANQMIAAGIPSEQVDAFLANRGQLANQSQQGGNQLVKAQPQITPYQQAQLAGQARDDARADQSLLIQMQNAEDARITRREAAEAKKAAAQDKPLPIGAQRLAFDLQDAVNGAGNIVSDMQSHLDALNSGTLDLSPAAVAAAKTRNAVGYTNEKSRAYADWESDRQRLVSDSLRLNKGVQTEGDAIRAVKELQSASDTASTKAAFQKLIRINERAAEQQKSKLTQLYRQYGLDENGDRAQPAASQAAPASSAGAADFSGLWN